MDWGESKIREITEDEQENFLSENKGIERSCSLTINEMRVFFLCTLPKCKSHKFGFYRKAKPQLLLRVTCCLGWTFLEPLFGGLKIGYRTKHLIYKWPK